MSDDSPSLQPLIGSIIRLTHLGNPLTPRLSDPRHIGACGRERCLDHSRLSRLKPPGSLSLQIMCLTSITNLSSLLSNLPLRPILNFCLSSYSLPENN
ncbi:hypothetical protein N7537_003767 [Penicillium hordei]|uniref:Uncharacterized protein n=1 Tax=Penicillium hordei TaxID=40994 RepID=A0AAD6EAR0_9EURO|nr:uncharacterized protein N7537_003767 [Penicillium hordei]KAJ5607148.1 hypothetical protein N7537_003767 [Penicillium hordei]